MNVSGNNLDSLSEIGSLRNLEQLIASNNCLSDMKEMVVLLKCWPKLWKLELTGNPLCLKNKYRERIIVLTPHLEMLDGKEIQEMSRQFLVRFDKKTLYIKCKIKYVRMFSKTGKLLKKSYNSVVKMKASPQQTT